MNANGIDEKLNEIKKITQELSRQDISLEESIKNYEKGKKLIDEVRKELEKAELAVKVINEGENNE